MPDEPAGENLPGHASDVAAPRSTLLYVDKQVPTFDRDAGSAITWEYLKLLSEIGFAVTFWPDDGVPLEPYTSALREAGIEVHTGKDSLGDCLAGAVREIDYVCLARPYVAAAHVAEVRKATRARIIYVAHDLHFLRYDREAEVVGGPKARWMAWRSRRLELDVCRQCDVTVVFNPAEKEVLLDIVPSFRIWAWPWVQEVVGEGPDFGERWGAVFVGSYEHSANADAVVWFAREVLPLVRRRIPELGFGVVGAHPPQALEGLDPAAVKVMGFVPDLAKCLNAARVFVAPLRYGAGVNAKILAAMAHGLPVVTTSIGAEGVGIDNERDVLIAETPEDLAEAVVTVHESRGLWKRLARESLDFVGRRASREHAKAILKADFRREAAT